MKKVLLVTHVSGFVPQFEMDNVRNLQNMGYEVHYASNYKTPGYGDDNDRLDGTGIIKHQIDFARSPFRMIQNYRAYKQLLELVKKEQFSLLHCHTPVGGAISRIVASRSKDRGLKVIYTVHGFHFFRGSSVRNWMIYYPVEKFLARYTDILITINEEDYKTANHFKLRHGGRVIKLNGVGIKTDKLADLYNQRNSSIPYSRGRSVRFLSVGELNRNKNHRLVIEALVKLGPQNLSYKICGVGGEENKLKKLICKYKLEQQVELVGYQRDMQAIYKDADVFIMPSLREGLSVALQEAMAAGLPVIATNIRGNRELVVDGMGGWLVSSNNIDKMAEAIKGALNADLGVIGKYNLVKIKEYDKKKVSLAMRDVYREILVEDIC